MGSRIFDNPGAISMAKREKAILICKMALWHNYKMKQGVNGQKILIHHRPPCFQTRGRSPELFCLGCILL